MADSYEAKKKQIIEKSKHIVARLGYNKTTMDDIANAVGMKKNSLYYYFENKESIFTEMFCSEIMYIEKGQKEILLKYKSSREKIEELIKYILDIHSTRSLSVRTFTLKAFFEIKTFLQENIEEFKIKQNKVFENLLLEGIKNKEFKKIDAPKLAGHISATINALMAYEFHKAKVNYVHELDFSEGNSTILGIIKYVLDGIVI